MTTRTARRACDRVEITVEGEPGNVYVCHCDFCQRMSGSAFVARASFSEDQVISVTGETGCFTIALGSFVDPLFPPPTTEYFTSFRHPWVSPIADAVQIEDPLGADTGLAWRRTEAGKQTDG